MIVEFLTPASQAVLLQSILQGEDGLAMVRCLDPEKKRQQFWTTSDQLDDLYLWLDSLPEHLNVEVTGEWVWHMEAKHKAEGAVNESLK